MARRTGRIARAARLLALLAVAVLSLAVPGTLYAAAGDLDPLFDPPGGANGTVFAMALQPDGKVLIGGGFTEVNGTPRNRIARLGVDDPATPTATSLPSATSLPTVQPSVPLTPRVWLPML